jgi:hypothetical protein
MDSLGSPSQLSLNQFSSSVHTLVMALPSVFFFKLMTALVEVILYLWMNVFASVNDIDRL